MWERIQGIEISEDELKSLSDESPIFRMYRTVSMLDRVVRELGHPAVGAKVANLAWTLANKVWRELRQQGDSRQQGEAA